MLVTFAPEPKTSEIDSNNFENKLAKQSKPVFVVSSVNTKHDFWKWIWNLKLDTERTVFHDEPGPAPRPFYTPHKPYTNEEPITIEPKSIFEFKGLVLDFIQEARKYNEKETETLAELDSAENKLSVYTEESLAKEFLNNSFSIKLSHFLPIEQLPTPSPSKVTGTKEIAEFFPNLSIFSDVQDIIENWYDGFLNEGVIEPALREYIVEDNPPDESHLTSLGQILSSFLPSDIVLYISKVLQKELREIVYIGPLRQQPERYYIHRGNKIEQVGKSGTMSADLLMQDEEVLKRTNEFFNKLRYELKVSPLTSPDGEVQDVYAIRLDNMETNIHANIADVGFGISQVLPVVVQSAVSQNATLCIEQPELHLHPGAQKELGDLFIESALGERKNTFIIETHSEHLILRILRRIRETTEGILESGRIPIKPEDVSVVYAKPSSTGTKLYTIEITEDGDFVEDWPSGFFTERVEELF